MNMKNLADSPDGIGDKHSKKDSGFILSYFK